MSLEILNQLPGARSQPVDSITRAANTPLGEEPPIEFPIDRGLMLKNLAGTREQLFEEDDMVATEFFGALKDSFSGVEAELLDENTTQAGFLQAANKVLGLSIYAVEKDDRNYLLDLIRGTGEMFGWEVVTDATGKAGVREKTADHKAVHREVREVQPRISQTAMLRQSLASLRKDFVKGLERWAEAMERNARIMEEKSKEHARARAAEAERRRRQSAAYDEAAVIAEMIERARLEALLREQQVPPREEERGARQQTAGERGWEPWPVVYARMEEDKALAQAQSMRRVVEFPSGQKGEAIVDSVDESVQITRPCQGGTIQVVVGKHKYGDGDPIMILKAGETLEQVLIHVAKKFEHPSLFLESTGKDEGHATIVHSQTPGGTPIDLAIWKSQRSDRTWVLHVTIEPSGTQSIFGRTLRRIFQPDQYVPKKSL